LKKYRVSLATIDALGESEDQGPHVAGDWRWWHKPAATGRKSIDAKGERGRCGIILRVSEPNSIFNFTFSPSFFFEDEEVCFPRAQMKRCLLSAFLSCVKMGLDGKTQFFGFHLTARSNSQSASEAVIIFSW
jgi:hypothetical protein